MGKPVDVDMVISLALPLLLLLAASTDGAGAPVFDPANPQLKQVLWQSCGLCLSTYYQSTKTASNTNYTIVPYPKRATSVNAYYLALPAAYTSAPTEKFPVILYLHGGGDGSTGDGANTDANKAKILQNGQLKHVNNGSWNNFTDAAGVVRPLPFIVIAPQTLLAAWDMPSEQVPVNNGSGFAELVNGTPRKIWQINEEANRDCDIVLKDAISRLRIDENRIYVTGLSQGGLGTWQALVRYPNVFAAAVPTAAKYSGLSGLDPLPICRAKDIPTWAFHNDGDPAISFYAGDKAVTDVNACHSAPADRKAKMHIYVGGEVGGKTAAERMQQYDAQGRPYTVKGSNSHDSWSTTYATFNRFANVKNNGSNLNIYAFLLQHQKVADPPQEPPTNTSSDPVRIGLDPSMLSLDQTIDYPQGTYLDIDNPGKLADEQALVPIAPSVGVYCLAADAQNCPTPQTAWTRLRKAGAIFAILDLGVNHRLADLYAYDYTGSGVLRIEAGAPGTWATVTEAAMTSYATWAKLPLGAVETRYLRITIGAVPAGTPIDTGNGWTKVPEILLYGNALA